MLQLCNVYSRVHGGADMADFRQAQEFVLRWEGGYCNDAGDPGGPTKYGVSLRWLRTVGLELGDIDGDGDIDIDDIRALNVEQAAELFRRKFWAPARLDNYCQQYALIYYDSAVNTGPAQAARFIQRAVNDVAGSSRLSVDGVLGALSRTAIEEWQDAPVFWAACINRREAFYKNLVSSRPVFAKFLRGWLNRTRALRRAVDV